MIFRDVILPSVLPDILTGLRTAVGVSYATLVAAEMIASASGLAWMVLDASKYIQYATVYAGIFIMGGIALLIDGGLKLLIRKAMPWQARIRSRVSVLVLFRIHLTPRFMMRSSQ